MDLGLIKMPRYEQQWSAQTNPAVLAKTISFIVSWPDDFFECNPELHLSWKWNLLNLILILIL